MGDILTDLRQTHPEAGYQTAYGHFYSTVGLNTQEIVRRLLSFGTRFPPLLLLTNFLPGLRIWFEAASPSIPAEHGENFQVVYRIHTAHYISAPSLFGLNLDRRNPLCLSRTMACCTAKPRQ